MPLPRDYPNNIGIDHGIVISRGGENDDHHDSTQAGNMQVFFPTKFGPSVQRDHIALSTKTMPATGGDQCTFAGMPDYGTVVTAFKETGRTDCVVLGQPNARNIGGDGSPGNSNLASPLDDLNSKSSSRSRPPDYKETQKNGALIREIVEKGEWFTNLTNGIPFHAAMSNIAGNKLPAIKNIPTALQHDANIMGADVLSQLPGIAMGLGDILKQVAGNSELGKALDPNLQQALASIQALSQNGEINESFTSRIDPTTISNNAVSLLSQCTTVDDLVSVTNQLLYDTSLHGSANTTIEVETAYGNTKITIDSSGSASSSQSEGMQKAIQAFLSMMQSASAYPNAKQENLFGESAKTKMDMSMRIPSNIFRELSEKLNTSGDAVKNWKNLVEKVINGENMFAQ